MFSFSILFYLPAPSGFSNRKKFKKKFKRSTSKSVGVYDIKLHARHQTKKWCDSMRLVLAKVRNATFRASKNGILQKVGLLLILYPLKWIYIQFDALGFLFFSVTKVTSRVA
jgi:hypothetical protein